MGIDSRYYTVYGVKTEWNDEFNEAYEAVYDECPVSFISESMCCEYMVFGPQLFCSGNLRFYDVEDQCTETSPKDLEKLKQEYIKEFMEWFPDFEYILDVEWKIITFLHLS